MSTYKPTLAQAMVIIKAQEFLIAAGSLERALREAGEAARQCPDGRTQTFYWRVVRWLENERAYQRETAAVANLTELTQG